MLSENEFTDSSVTVWIEDNSGENALTPSLAQCMLLCVHVCVCLFLCVCACL